MPLIPKQWILSRILTPVLRPFTRLIVALIAIPLLRAIRRRFTRWQQLDEELEKDVEQWFRASLLLLFATKNVEMAIVDWFTGHNIDLNINDWWIAGGRLLLAIGVVESMPDQALFPLIHPGPPKLKWIKKTGLWGNIRQQAGPFLKGILCQHLNRSSPVFAIMAAIFDDTIGWVFYFLAIAQYLVIGLVTSQDKALDVLAQFDKQMELRRQELIDEFEIDDKNMHRRIILSRSSSQASKDRQSGQQPDDHKNPANPENARPPAVDAPPPSGSTTTSESADARDPHPADSR